VSGEQDGLETETAVRLLSVLVAAHRGGYRQLTCPACGAPPLAELWVISGGGQAMCPTEECPALMWDPRLPARELLVAGHHVTEETDDQGRTTWR
jgi:hypothetical protein